MGKTIYSKCVELIKDNFKKGDEVGLMKLHSLIMVHIGGQNRTIQTASNVMIQTKLLKDIGNGHFKIL